MLSRTSVTREANTVKTNSAYQKLLQPFNFLSGFAMLLSWLLLPAMAAGQVSSVQVNSSDAVRVNRSVVAVPFTTAQAAHNLNVVAVGWNDTSTSVVSVTDSNGNTYALAATTESTPVPSPSGLQVGVSQAIYYAKDINAGANTVTVTFNQTTAVQSVRIVEYTGLDTVSPLDTSVGNNGTALIADSGAVTTNSANDLLFGAGTITTGFTAAGTGFNTVLINGLSDIVEEQVVATAASHNATAVLTSGAWVMQMVAFRAAGQTPPTFAAPTISSLSANSGPEAGGTAVTITGTNFQSGAAVLFSTSGGFTAPGVNCSVISSTSINCLTPSFPVGAANITVTNVDGQASSPSAFTFTASTPFATAASPSITPATGLTNGGTVVTISGSDFAAGAAVTVGGLPADRVAVINVNTILVSLPAGKAGLAPVVVTNPSGTGGTLPGGYTYAAGATGINFVQQNSVQSATTTAAATYGLAQTAGNLNVVVVGWADTTTTVPTPPVDSAGNTYTLAFPATVGNGLSQAIYFAKNIVASPSNTVTVTFSAATQSDVRILEYNGLDTVNPLDDTNGATGSSAKLDSGSAFTTVSGDLVVGASMAGGTVITTGPTFTTVATTPGGITVEHLVGPAAGAINATAIQDSSTNWIMQAVAFKQAVAVPDFTIGVTPPNTATVAAGSPATYTVSVAAVNGFNSVVTLTCSGLPLGTSCAFNPPAVTAGPTAVTSVLTITTTAATPPATSTVTATGTFGSLSHDTTVSLTVTADFAIAATALSPASVVAGTSATSTVTITPTSGFTGTVTLSCGSIIPTGTNNPTCAFVPPTITGSGTSTLTVSTVALTSPVAYTVTITGTSGALNHSTTGSLTVTAPAADFTIAATALAPATVAAGASSTSTVTIAPAPGTSFNSAVALTCSVAPVVKRGPTCALNPASVANGSGTSVLTVSTTAATTASLTPHSRGVFYAMLLPIAGLAFLGTGITSRKKKLWGFLLGCLLFSTLIILPACGGSGSGGGGGHPGTPAGSYTVTVTGTSGSLTHTATASVTVQ